MPPWARINKNGIYIAKPDRTVDDGPNYQFFAPGMITQSVYLSGAATSFADYTDTTGPDAWRTYYKIATIGLGKPFARPPIVYFMARDTSGDWWIPIMSELRFNGSVRGQYPVAKSVASTTQVQFWVNRATFNAVRYYIMENTLP